MYRRVVRMIMGFMFASVFTGETFKLSPQTTFIFYFFFVH